jgi:hypothetical protein
MKRRRSRNPLFSKIISDIPWSTLPADTDPLTLAVSREGLGYKLTSVQRIILGLMSISRGAELPEFTQDAEVALSLMNLTGESSGNPRIWLPPDCEIGYSGRSISLHFASPITSILCVAGRRGGKTTMSSILMAWLARQILINPGYLDTVHLLPGSVISLLNVACETNQARILFNMLESHLSSLNLIPGEIKSLGSLTLGTNIKLRIESLSSSSRSARGRTAAGACLDEFAHFQRSAGPFADRAMWLALAPSVTTFGDKGLVAITTSPAGRSGVVWDLFQQRGVRAGMLTLQLPTWVMNPYLPRERLDDEFDRDDYLARQEYGAEFLAPNGQFLKWPLIVSCAAVTIPSPKSRNTRWHIHVDLGLVDDSTAIALGFIEPSEHGEGERVVITELVTLDGTHENPVKIEDVEGCVIAMISRIPHGSSFEATFDQHQSAYIIERLKSKGIDAKAVHTTSRTNEESYSILRDLVTSGHIVYPSEARLLDELAGLECTPTPGGFKVEAGSGGHDDCADAVAMCAWGLYRGKGGWEDILDVVDQRET